MRRNHLAKDDLDWLPPRYRLLRGLLVSGVWTALGGGIVYLGLHGGALVLFGKLFVVLGAAGYWVGDRASKRLVASRLGKLARGEVDLARLSNQEDGELVHVRGRVRATNRVSSVVSAEEGVYRRTRVVFDDVQVIDEEAVDFQLVDEEGNAIGIEVENARLLVQDEKPEPASDIERFFPMAQDPASLHAVNRYRARKEMGQRFHLAVAAAEVMLSPGDLVEAVGYKSRRVDPTLVDRLARETPMRATLRGGKDLPLILSRTEP